MACRNMDCRSDEPGPHRDVDGYREWTADFTERASDHGPDWQWWPDEGEDALRCRDCHEVGVIYAY